MRIFKRAHAATLTAALTTALLATAAPAVAEPSTAEAAGDCPFTTSLCLFEGENFTGERLVLESPSSGVECVNLADHGWSMRANSAINTGRNSAILFLNENCIGDPFQIPPNSSKATIGFGATSAMVQG